MRVWHLFYATFLVAVLLRVGETPAGRVSIVVFIGGLGLVLFATAGIMELFQTLGSLGAAENVADRTNAALATALVVVLSALAMSGVLILGASLIRAALD